MMSYLQVNDIICLPLEKADNVDELTPILACQDRTLKVMKVKYMVNYSDLDR